MANGQYYIGSCLNGVNVIVCTVLMIYDIDS